MALLFPFSTASWRCASCRTLSATSHAFTTSSSVLARPIPPESPDYIDVPEPPQQTAPVRPRIKGTLPRPRDIFHAHKGGVDRVTDEYLAAATPTSQKAVRGLVGSRREWQQRMTERRKQNFREGLTELQKRRKDADAYHAERSARNREAHQRLIDAAEREDERLTNPTTALLMQTLQKGYVLPDPNREQRVAEMKARVAAREAKRAGDRRDALHTLYMHARTFIVSEGQLDSAIDRAFGTQTNPVKFGNSTNNIWYRATPESIQDLLNRANKARGNVADDEWAGKALAQRIGEIAEQFTGGKM